MAESKRTGGPSDRENRAEAGFHEIVARLDRLWADERGVTLRASADLRGQDVGSYRVLQVIGQGAFGLVYHAIDRQLGESVALKVPRPEVLFDKERFARFQREAAAMAKLKHPGIIAFHEAQFDQGTPYIAFDYCPGPDLGAWLRRRSESVSAADAAAFTVAIADAVHFAHQQGVLHRDLKPSNILLQPRDESASGDELSDFTPRLADFGLAKLLEGGLFDTRSSMLVGTPHYMAPEQLARDSRLVTESADIYAIGIILFELLTREMPFVGSTYIEVLDQVRHATPRQLRELNETIPRDLETICLQCLAKDPESRYASARLLADDLERFLSGQEIVARRAGWRDDLIRWCRQPQRLATAGLTGMVVQAFLLAWMWANFFTLVLAGQIDRFVGAGLRDCLAVTVAFTIPIGLLNWLVYRRKRWAYLPVLLFLILQIAVQFHAYLYEGLVFDWLYPSYESKISSYTMLSIALMIQLTMSVVAFPAWLRNPQPRKVHAPID